jgi:hypothetical protein
MPAKIFPIPTLFTLSSSSSDFTNNIPANPRVSMERERYGSSSGSPGCVDNGFTCANRGSSCGEITGSSEEGEASNKDEVGSILDASKEESFYIANRSAMLGKRYI